MCQTALFFATSLLLSQLCKSQHLSNYSLLLPAVGSLSRVLLRDFATRAGRNQDPGTILRAERGMGTGPSSPSWWQPGPDTPSASGCTCAGDSSLETFPAKDARIHISHFVTSPVFTYYIYKMLTHRYLNSIYIQNIILYVHTLYSQIHNICIYNMHANKIDLHVSWYPGI